MVELQILNIVAGADFYLFNSAITLISYGGVISLVIGSLASLINRG